MSYSATQYDIVRASWTPSGGGTGARAVITAPDSTTTTVSASSASALPNVWTIWFSVEQVGTYQILWQVVGGVQTFSDTAVVAAFVPLQLLTIQNCYDSLSIPQANIGKDTTRDADMLVYGQAALGVVEGIVGPLVRQYKSQIFDGGNGSVKLSFEPTTILNVIENGQTIYDWVVDMPSGILRAGTTWWNRPFWPGIQNIEIQYMSGSGNVPPNAILAVREEFRFLWQQGRQGHNAQANAQIMETLTIPQGFAIPARVYELLQRVDSMPGFA